ncbi:Uncharacterised protein [uncultured archaeon]|nr:Uncharacterised protein [uncultured archaeon]
MKNNYLVLISVAVMVFSLIGTSMAGIDVVGAIIRADIAPGDHFNAKSTISIASSDKPMDFNVTMAGFGQSTDGGSIELGPSQQTSFMPSFLTVTPNKFHLEPGMNQTIIVDGTVPPDAKAGGKYALINLKSQPKGVSNVGISLAIDIPIELTITGGEPKVAGEITSLALADPATSQHQNGTAIFNNTGNYFYKIKSNSELKDDKGTVVASVDNPLGPLFLIPPNARKIDFKLAPEKPLAPGKYTLTATVSLEDGTVLATKDTSVEIKS